MCEWLPAGDVCMRLLRCMRIFSVEKYTKWSGNAADKWTISNANSVKAAKIRIRLSAQRVKMKYALKIGQFQVSKNDAHRNTENDVIAYCLQLSAFFTA